jgi:hypothetical protein
VSDRCQTLIIQILFWYLVFYGTVYALFKCTDRTETGRFYESAVRGELLMRANGGKAIWNRCLSEPEMTDVSNALQIRWMIKP